MNAITEDATSWGYHVCDLGRWRSEAAISYGIGFLPQNFLIDGNGKIIAYNLRGEDVRSEISKYLK